MDQTKAGEYPMNSLTQVIATRVSTLPEQKQREALDLTEFLQIKPARENAAHSNLAILANPETLADAQTEGAKVFCLLEVHALLGCMEGTGKLSENFKKQLWGKDDYCCYGLAAVPVD